MYTVIEDEKNIKKYQEIFLKILQEGAEPLKDVNIGHQGRENNERHPVVYWLPDKELWSSSYKRTKGGNRYVNWFGLTDPRNNTPVSIIGEISISIEGSGSAGKFVKKGEKIYIAHNGNIKKKNKSLKGPFLDHCRGKNWKIIQIDDKELVLIDELPSDKVKYSDFQSKIKSFIEEVEEIKNNLNKTINKTSKAITNENKNSEQTESEQQSISNNKKNNKKNLLMR